MGIRKCLNSRLQLSHQETKQRKKPALKLGCWNVQIMMTGLSENFPDISDSRKTAIINDKLRRVHVDIATLGETRLADSGTLKEKDYTFYWEGKGSDEPREHGVNFAVRNNLLNMVKPGSNGTERLLTLHVNTTEGPVTLVSVFAPTLSSTPDTKDEFYKKLASIIASVPSKEQLVLLGDINARVGADHDSWPSCLGQFSVGKMNENGQRLLCSYHELCIASSYFRTKPQHKVSWRHPRSKHWHQLDLILVRHAAIKNVLHTRSYHSADCDTDHSLVCCKIRL
ncbi:craniofacial development protein 2-like [Pholidichthys leucotaenia]